MSRTAKPATARSGSSRGAGDDNDEIESEFLGIWLGIARLREKVLALTGRTEPRPQR
jgi:hypothetical protein